MREFVCAECGRPFMGKRTHGKDPMRCSNACRAAYLSREGSMQAAQEARTRKAEQAKALKELIKIAKKQEKLEAKRLALLRFCACGTVLRPNRQLCSDCLSANAKAHKKREKAVRRARQTIEAESVRPSALFERDRWKCQMCGVKTPKKLIGSNEAREPTLDHIVPLALGGSHTWANLQCMCRACNVGKSTRPFGQINLGFAL